MVVKLEDLKFETTFDRKKIKEKLNDFMMQKYGKVKEPSDKDFREFEEKIKEEIKSGIISRLYPDIPTTEKDKLKREIIVKIEKDYLTGG
jgi:hypothetical protein